MSIKEKSIYDEQIIQILTAEKGWWAEYKQDPGVTEKVRERILLWALIKNFDGKNEIVGMAATNFGGEDEVKEVIERVDCSENFDGYVYLTETVA